MKNTDGNEARKDREHEGHEAYGGCSRARQRTQTASVVTTGTTAANVTRVKLEWNESAVGMACPIKECDWSSPLAKKADCGSYSIAGFESSA